MNEEKLKNLVQEMTLSEKIDQLLQLIAEFYSNNSEEKTGPMTDLDLNEDNIKNTGSILGVSGAAESIRIQKEYMMNHRLGIPTLLMADIIHGFRTIFPIPLALGCSWDTKAAEKMAAVSAKEASVSGVHVTFSPMVDLVRDPRWGRVMESTGEDPYLNARFAEAFVKGYQGNDLKNDFSRIAACVKHFAAYGAALAGRDYNTVDMSERQLRENYLPSYQAAMAAGAKLVMTSFNTIEGIPATGNKWLLRKVLREDFQFDGVVISDWGAVKELIPHGVAADEKEAAKLALTAGVDIEMMTSCYAHYLQELIEEKKIADSLVDEAVLRILELKNDLGLFENPYRGASVEGEKVILSTEHREFAREIAQKSVVLLKNEEILPLTMSEKVAIVGPGAKSKDVLGAWSWQGKTDEAVSLAEGALAASEHVLVGQEKFDYFAPSEAAINEAVALAKESEKVVLALGEAEWMSGEAASRSDIRLPESQIAFFKKIQSVNSEIILTIYSGRPLDLSGVSDAKAIVEAWFLGTEAGNAIADILWGKYNPSGRLCMSFPENVGQVPIFYNCDSTGRPAETTVDEKYSSKYLDVSNYAKYPFGYGLSYSNFKYGPISLDQTELKVDELIKLTLKITNDSKVNGTETVQLYVQDLVGEVVRPVKELKAFQKVALTAGETKQLTFEIKEEMLRYVHTDQTHHSDAGTFQAMIGPNSSDLQKIGFTLIK